MKNSWVIFGTFAMTLLSTAVTSAAETGHPSRQEEVARKGAGIMPFDLRRTTHFFADTSTGGVETVTANGSHDVEQITLIRAHLTEEARRLARGDFSDPAAIHGMDMPGLATLTAAGHLLSVEYMTVPNGASITYSSRDKKVVAAIHDWFAAQRSDHGAHARMPMNK